MTAKRKKIAPWKCADLKIHVRGSTFYASGTLRRGGLSRLVRKSLEVVADRENMRNAETEARRLSERVYAEMGGGVVRRAVSTLVAERFESHIGPTDERILREFTEHFTVRILWNIPATEIVAFVDDRQRRNSAETRERYISGICAFLNGQVKLGQYPQLPEFKRDKNARNPLKRARRDVQQFRIELLEDIIAHAHVTLAIQLRVEYVAGARVSSLLQGCSLGDLDLVKMVLTFRNTKNGDDVPCALPRLMKQALEIYLTWRQLQVRRGRIGPGSDQPLFLHYKGFAYKPNGGAWGTQNKVAFRNAKRRAMRAVAERYDIAIQAMRAVRDQVEVDRLLRLKTDDLALLKKITQHWLRHKFATETGRKDIRAAMAQGGWRDPRSIHGYLIADAEFQRAIIEERGTPAVEQTG